MKFNTLLAVTILTSASADVFDGLPTPPPLRGPHASAPSYCNRFCSADYDPVYDTQGNTYSNMCYFEIAQCKDPSIMLLPPPSCDRFCSADYDPAYDTQGNSYSKEAFTSDKRAYCCKNEGVGCPS